MDDLKTPVWFKLWFGFCGLLGLGFLVLIGWLIVTAVQYLNRH